MLRRKLESSITNSLKHCDTVTLIAVYRAIRRAISIHAPTRNVTKLQIIDLLEYCNDERVLEIVRQILIRN